MTKSEGLRSMSFNDYKEKDPVKIIEKYADAKVVFITKKGKVIAHAKWEKGDLKISKIRRKSSGYMKVGDVLYRGYKQFENIPPCPELRTEGWQLVRMKAYDSSRAKREDPFWKDYQGWIIIPDKIDGRPAIDDLLVDFGDKIIGKNGEKQYEVLPASAVDVSTLRLADYDEIDHYVIGQTDNMPVLQPFSQPKSEDMIKYRASVCFCGCGKFEGWRRYWRNKWVVYLPRK